MAFTSEVLTLERDGHVATLWLDSPERRNAMGPALWADLPVMMEDVSDDDDVRSVVKTMGAAVAGDGSGAQSEAARRKAALRGIKRLQGSINAVADCPKPVIAAVHGWCIGGGIDLISACDIRVASADAVFSVRETKIAIVADLGTLQRLPGVVSRGHVAELAYTGKDISADRAGEIGLVNQVLPDADACHKAAHELATEIASNSPLAVQGTKAVLRASEGRTVAEGLDYVGVWNAAFLASNDLTEAFTAFLEKRPPKFTGQ
jgi:enoyl-CoA hydratase